MTSILSLPLYTATDGVGVDEDWIPSFAFLAADGVTPIDLTGIIFTTKLVQSGSTATTFTGSTQTGEIVISGSGNNILTITVLEAAKASWAATAYAWGLLANDGTYHRDVFAGSSLRVGSPQILSLSALGVPGQAAALLSSMPPAQVTASALAGLSRAQLLALANAILGAIPNAQNSESLPDAGLPYLDADGFYANSQ